MRRPPSPSVVTVTVVDPWGVVPVTVAADPDGNPEPSTATNELSNGRLVTCGSGAGHREQ